MGGDRRVRNSKFQLSYVEISTSSFSRNTTSTNEQNVCCKRRTRSGVEVSCRQMTSCVVITSSIWRSSPTSSTTTRRWIWTMGRWAKSTSRGYRGRLERRKVSSVSKSEPGGVLVILEKQSESICENECLISKECPSAQSGMLEEIHVRSNCDSLGKNVTYNK